MMDLSRLTPVAKADLKVHGKDDGMEGHCPRCKTVTGHITLDPNNQDAWYCINCATEDEPGLWWLDKHSRGIGFIQLNIYADPLKSPDTPEGKIWSTDVEATIGTARYRQEYLNDHDVGTGASIYPSFSPTLHLAPELEFNPLYPLWLGYDPGLIHAGMVIGQWVGRDLHILTEILTHDAPIEHVFKELWRIMKVEFFHGWGMGGVEPTKILIEDLQWRQPARLRCVADIASKIRMNDGVSSEEFAKNFGFHFRSRFATPIKRIEKVRALLEPKEDGTPRLKLRGRTYMIHGSEPARPLDASQPGTLQQGFMGGYKFKQDGKGEIATNRFGPQADKSIESHLMDALAEMVEHGMVIAGEEHAQLADVRQGQRDFCDIRALNAGYGKMGSRDYQINEELSDFYYSPI